MKYNKNYFVAIKDYETNKLIASPVKASDLEILTCKPFKNKIKLFITKLEDGSKGYILNEYYSGARVQYFDTLKQLNYNIENTDLLRRIDEALSSESYKKTVNDFQIAKQNRIIEDLETYNIWNDYSSELANRKEV